MAGERGWRIFSSPVVVPIDRLQQDVAAYSALLNEHNTPRRGDEIALMAPAYVSSSLARGREHPEASITSYFQALESYVQPEHRYPGRRPPYAGDAGPPPNHDLQHMLDNFAIFGDPAYCIERIQWLKETFGIGQFIAWFNTGGKIPQAQVMESMRLFAQQVMPYID